MEKLELNILFDWEAAGNPFFFRIYHHIYSTLKFQKHLKVQHIQPDYSNGACMSCPGGRSNLQIINPQNQKTILMSFWDRGMDVFLLGLGWEDYNIVQYIGGLGMRMSSEEIFHNHGIKHQPFQYPLGVKDADLMINYSVQKSQYSSVSPKQKAVFIGQRYGTREPMMDTFRKTEFIDVFEPSDGFSGQAYFDKLSEYSIVISLNGNGEFCMRDLEGMGLGIPVVRSELKTQFHNKLVPGVHYLKGSEACEDAWHTYPGLSIKDVTDSFISVIDKNLKDPSKLRGIGSMGQIYYRNFANPAYISNLFIDLIDLNELV